MRSRSLTCGIRLAVGRGMNKKLLLGIGGVLGVGAYVIVRKLRANAAPEPIAPFAVHQDALPTIEPLAEVEALPDVEPVQPPPRSSKKRNRRKSARTSAPRRVRRKSKR